MGYAEKTSVDIMRTVSQIEQLVNRHGADGFSYARDQTKAVLQFRLEGRMIRYQVTLPDQSDKLFTHTPSQKWERQPEEAWKAWEQACRAIWRKLLLLVTAKLEGIAAGITSVDEEFMSWIVLPDNSTVGDHMLKRVAQSYEDGNMPPMLPEGRV